MNYDEFVSTKLLIVPPVGITKDVQMIDGLFPHQQALVKWALRRGRCAIFADTGLGKTRMQVAWADVVNRETGCDVLILAPLAVAQQTASEAAECGVIVRHVHEASEVHPGISITNHDRLHKFDTSRFGAVVLDECFAAGTLIDCESGRKRIQDIRKGDKIYNASGLDIVADTHRREVSHGIKIKSQGQHFIASPNHPIFTQRGWVGAQDLRPGDYALAAGAAVSLVRNVLFSKGSSTEGAAVLRDILLSEMANEYARAQGEGSQAGDICKNSCGEQGMEEFGSSNSDKRAGTDQVDESDFQHGSSGEDFARIESHEARTFRAWGQWDWANGVAGVHGECAWIRLDSGICFVTGPTDTGLSDTLQAGLGEPGVANRPRTGWQLPLCEEIAGLEEGLEAGFVRLDGIEILEPGHPELESLRDADGKLYFYDIGATRHPSFSVNGLLVHNSSVIKHHTSKTLQALLDAFRNTPYRLCATATPAPNDWTELGTHAEFLGIRSRAEMLAEFFVHDGGDTQTWRVKGHARQLFWKWVSSWGVMLRSPADLGFDASGYDLPPLEVHQHTVDSGHDQQQTGFLFAMEASDLMERRQARKASLDERVKACADMVNASDEHWIIWCDLNAEGEALRAAIHGAVEVKGADDESTKEQRLMDFAAGKTRVLISKASICGWGLNFQVCRNVAFVGVTDSFEAYYQAVRRCYRFGQKRSVQVHIFASEQEGSIVSNLKRKEADAKAMGDALATEVMESVKSELFGQQRESNEYRPSKAMNLPTFLRAA